MHFTSICRACNLYWRPLTVTVRHSSYSIILRKSWLNSNRPQVNEQSLSLETTHGKQYRLDESLFERMMLPTNPAVRPLATSRLNIQRRMHPDIADIMRATLYPFLVVFQKSMLYGITDVNDYRTMSAHTITHLSLAWLSDSGGSITESLRTDLIRARQWRNHFRTLSKSKW